MFETTSKTLPITKDMVRLAYRKVRSNKGSAGVDKESLEDFQKDLSGNLYKLWNRMASGSYFPKAVKEVAIPKANGGTRKLGIPTVSDRIAQQVIKTYLEPRLEMEFSENLYGYRPIKNAHQALEQVRKNVREYAWVLDIDIKNFFDEVDHDLLTKALDKHVEERWVKFYIKRWLETPIQKADGSMEAKQGKGTPQGGVISPLLANLYLHYVLDKWMELKYPEVSFVRYADDIVVHCNTEEQAKEILESIRERMAECRLRMNEEKTKIVYCVDYRRKKNHYQKQFDFLGFSFKPMTCLNKDKGLFTVYDCIISQKSQTKINEKWKELGFYRKSTLSMQQIAEMVNPIMRGVINYYGKFNYWRLRRVAEQFHYRLARWALKKYKRFKNSFKKAYRWIKEIKSSYEYLFCHWKLFKYL